MRYLLCLLLCLPLAVYAQVVAVENAKDCIFYLGVDNDIVMAASGMHNGSLVVATDNGIIMQHGFPNKKTGYCIYRPDHLGHATIYVKRKTKTGLVNILVKHYNVLPFPAPTPTLMNRMSGATIPYKEARLSIGLGAVVFGGGDYGCVSYRIDSFTITIIRKGEVELTRVIAKENGARFSDDSLVFKFLPTLQPGDHLIFSCISCESPARNGRLHLAPMEFTLVE